MPCTFKGIKFRGFFPREISQSQSDIVQTSESDG